MSAAIAAGYYCYRHFDETLRDHIEALLAAGYPHLKVAVRSAEVIKGEGILVRGVTIAEPGAAGPRGELLYFDEMQLACNTDWQEFLTKELEVTTVTIRRPTLWATRRPDGNWSSVKLLPWPKFGQHPPLLKIEGGTIEIFDPLSAPASTLVLREVELTLTPPPPLGAPTPEGQVRRLQGTLVSDHFRQLVIDGQIDPYRWRWSIDGSVELLDLSPELRAALPQPLAARLDLLRVLRGQAKIAFRLSYDKAAAAPYAFEVSGRLARGRIEDPQFPNPLTDVHAAFHCDNGGYAIEDLGARSGQSTLKIRSYRRAGYSAASRGSLSADLLQWDLDWRWLGVLPEALRDTLGGLRERYFPMGQIDADLKLDFDGQTWKPEVLVRCLNVSFTYRNFQYRLESGKGTLELKNGRLRLDLVAQNNSHPVRLSAEVLNPLTPLASTGWFEAKGDELPLDETLFDALPPRQAAIVRGLEPRGMVSFYFNISRDQPGQPTHKVLKVGVNRCALRFKEFPYPVSNVRGKLEMNDDQWSFNLEGTNSTGRLSSTGGFLRSTPAGPELYLPIDGADIPLEEDLRAALRPNMRELWDKLRPHGAVDLTAQIHYLPAQNHLGVTVWAEPQNDRTWIEPVAFPYRMERLHGRMIYQDGKVTLERLRAEHGPVRASATGTCDFHGDGSWNFKLAGLSVDRLSLDPELVSALPGRVRRPLADLKLSGPCNLRGTLEFQSGGRPSDLIRSGWNVQAGFQRGSIDCGGKLDNICGEVSLVGGFDGQTMQCRGELDDVYLTCHDVQLAQLRGPFWLDDQQVLLGTWVDRPSQATPRADPSAAGRKPRSLTAKLWNGTLFADGWIDQHRSPPHFSLKATLVQADLRRCAQETMSAHQDLEGKICADLTLHGAGRSIGSLGGSGTIQLREANIYEVPQMIRLLKILSFRPPDAKDFSQSDIDFKIADNHVYFDRIDFRGDAISLLGKGEMTFDSRLGLTFHAMIGRGEWHLPVFHEILGRASEQIMLIHVGGTLQEPQMRREALPQVNQVLQMFQGSDAPASVPEFHPQAK